MVERSAFAGANALVIGFGNTLRGDDGVGTHVAGVAASWGLPGLRSLAVAQLTPEQAEPLAAAELVIFVDARLGGRGEAIEVRSIEPSESCGTISHVSDARSMLALARAVYGCQPRAWLITIPAADFSLGERFSPIAKRSAEAALARVCTLLDVGPCAGRAHAGSPQIGGESVAVSPVAILQGKMPPGAGRKRLG